MFSFGNMSNSIWSAAKSFAVCSSCANTSAGSSENSVYGTVLMAVPFFVLSVILCLSNSGLVNIIVMVLLALILIGKSQCCQVKEAIRRFGFGA